MTNRAALICLQGHPCDSRDSGRLVAVLWEAPGATPGGGHAQAQPGQQRLLGQLAGPACQQPGLLHLCNTCQLWSTLLAYFGQAENLARACWDLWPQRHGMRQACVHMTWYWRLWLQCWRGWHPSPRVGWHRLDKSSRQTTKWSRGGHGHWQGLRSAPSAEGHLG